MLLKFCVIYSLILIASVIWMWKEPNHKDNNYVCPDCWTKCNYLAGGICQCCDEEKRSHKALL